MEDLIRAILKIEADGQAIVKDAKEMEKNFDEITAKQTRALEQDIFARMQKKLNEMKLRETENLEKQLATIDREGSEALARLDAQYAAHGQRWIDAIYTDIIEGK